LTLDVGKGKRGRILVKVDYEVGIEGVVDADIFAAGRGRSEATLVRQEEEEEEEEERSDHRMNAWLHGCKSQ
jgi:hypothetical protein